VEAAGHRGVEIAARVVGLISGTPTAPGSYAFTVAVSDSASPTAQAVATYQNVVIAQLPPPVINAVNLAPIATLGSPYVAFAFGAVGRHVQTSWKEVGTPMPPAGSFPIMSMKRQSKITLAGVFCRRLTKHMDKLPSAVEQAWAEVENWPVTIVN
jgi:hypothetical protein